MLESEGENFQKEAGQWPEKGTHRNKSSENSTEAEVFIAEGMTAAEAARKIGVSEQTYYRWRKEYGGMRVDQAQEAQTTGEGEPEAT